MKRLCMVMYSPFTDRFLCLGSYEKEGIIWERELNDHVLHITVEDNKIPNTYMRISGLAAYKTRVPTYHWNNLVLVNISNFHANTDVKDYELDWNNAFFVSELNY